MREYLDRAPYGNRIRGIERAARFYFARPARDLTLAQAAFLAGLPWAPVLLNPLKPMGFERAKERMRWILKRAFELGWIGEREYREALSDPIEIEPVRRRERSSIHFTERIAGALRRGKFRPIEIWTSLDRELQREVEGILRRQIRRWQRAGARTGGVAVADVSTGEILAYVASPDYFSEDAKGAIDYLRLPHSPGSTLKPFIYEQALEHLGFTGATLLPDVSAAFLWRSGYYSPHNDDRRFLGPLRMRVALGNSRNIPAVKTLSRLGIKRTLNVLKKLGFFSIREPVGLGLAIGGTSVAPLELLRGYLILGNYGKSVNLKWLKWAVDGDGNRVELPESWRGLFLREIPENERILDADAVKVILDILSDPLARLPSFARFRSLEYEFTVAVKTGTSQGRRDALTAAVSTNYAVICWIGNPERKKISGGSGGRLCAPVVKRVFKALHRRYPQVLPSKFALPQNWRRRKVCPLSGYPVGPDCPGEVEEWFPESWVPKATVCPFHKRLPIDRRNQLRAGEGCPEEFVTYKPFLSLPAEFAEWGLAVGTLPLPPPFSPLCPPRSSRYKREIYIVFPLDGMRLIRAPNLPSELSTLTLRARSLYPYPYLLWYHNSVQLAKVPWPYTYHWPLRGGVHRFYVTSPDGKVISQVVSIRVLSR